MFSIAYSQVPSFLRSLGNLVLFFLFIFNFWGFSLLKLNLYIVIVCSFSCLYTINISSTFNLGTVQGLQKIMGIYSCNKYGDCFLKRSIPNYYKCLYNGLNQPVTPIWWTDWVLLSRCLMKWLLAFIHVCWLQKCINILNDYSAPKTNHVL